MPGYSLFELLVVLAVIAFAAMLAPPVVNALRPELQTEKIAGEMAGALRLARSRAVTEGEAVRLTVITKPRSRSRFLCNHEIVFDGRPDWLELPNCGGQTGRENALAEFSVWGINCKGEAFPPLAFAIIIQEHFKLATIRRRQIK